MWQQTPGDKVTWAAAVAAADSFALAGHSDWRLPTIKELYSLILFSGTDPSGCQPGGACDPVPFLDTNYFDFEYGDTSAGERLIDAQYWSITEYVSVTMGGDATVFGVNFADGRIKGYPRDVGPGGLPNTQFVRYVRGNTNYGLNDFADNGDGTITDTATGLTWSQADSGVGMNWRDALRWVDSKNDENYLGHSDWRLPNAKELQSIIDYTRSPATTNSAAIDPIFGVTPIIDEGGAWNFPFYWTGTTHADNEGFGRAAVYIAFGEALGFMEIPPGSGVYYLQDVHGAGAQRSDPKVGDPSDYPHGRGPQGDVIRIYNYVRCVRGGQSELTQTSLASPANESILYAPAAFTWAADGGANNIFAVDFSLSYPIAGYWSTYENLRQPVVSESWTMSETLWNFIPPQSYVYWRVRAADLDASPLTIIYSGEVWWFYKP